MKYPNDNSMYLPYSLSPLETLQVKYTWPSKFIENKTITKVSFRVVIWFIVTFPSTTPSCQPQVCFLEIFIRRASLNFKIGVRTMSPPSILVHLYKPQRKKKKEKERISYLMPNRSSNNVSSINNIVSCHHTCICVCLVILD